MSQQKSLQRTILLVIQFSLIAVLIFANLFLANKIFNLFESQLEHPVQITSTASSLTPKENKTPLYNLTNTPQTIYKKQIRPNSFFSTLLSEEGIDSKTIFELTEKCQGVFDVRTLKAGKTLTLIHQDPCTPPSAIVYEPTIYSYILFDIDNQEVKRIDRPITTKIETTSGVVRSSLWESMDAGGNSWELISLMESALGWAVDFYHISNGDKYKLVYERKYVDGKPAGIGQLLGAYYNTNGQEFYSLWYENDKFNGYYDINGRAAKSRFLKAPVKFARISSRYNLRRFHPVLKRRRPHLGTDYAAPYGTPILAVADGTVIIAGRSRGNGRYVKIKHDKTYQTQYLHMSRFAKGIRRGVRVRQGQVIGYVGSSGLSTGPHVCFRFWKNGRQVNHLKLRFPASKPLPDSVKQDFFCTTKPIVQMLDEIPYKKDENSILAQNDIK